MTEECGPEPMPPTDIPTQIAVPLEGGVGALFGAVVLAQMFTQLPALSTGESRKE